MINVETKIKETKEKPTNYPSLKRLKDDRNFIVLFTTEGLGILLRGKHLGDRRLYREDANWAEKEFVALQDGESVTLSND